MSKHMNYEFENCDCYCDNSSCGSFELVDENDFTNVNREIRALGWLIKNINGSWYDFCCEECYQKFMDKNKNKHDKHKYDDWS